MTSVGVATSETSSMPRLKNPWLSTSVNRSV